MIINLPQNQSFIIGKTVREKLDYRIKQEGVALECHSVLCHVTDSNPTGKSNTSFPDDILYEDHIVDYKVNENSTVCNFIHKQTVIFHDASQQQAIEMKEMTSNDAK